MMGTATFRRQAGRASGDLTYDGLYKYTYDSWNRLVKVERAYPGGTGSVVAALSYDALGRRIKKVVTNSGDWDATHHYYHDGRRVIETRSGGDRLLKQHVWGLAYVDELVQVGINQDPEDPQEDDGGACERFFWALQDANYNVLGLVSKTGLLVERYEYTPYGRRTVFSRNWLLADLNGDGMVNAGDLAMYSAANTEDPNDPADMNGNGTVCDVGDLAILSGSWDDSCSTNDALVSYPTRDSCGGRWAAGGGTDVLTTGTCDIGHQGLFFDKEFGCYDNRARIYGPFLARFHQHDPLGYVDGMSVYEFVKSEPLGHIDPSGLRHLEEETTPNTKQRLMFYRDNWFETGRVNFIAAKWTCLCGGGWLVNGAKYGSKYMYIVTKKQLERTTQGGVHFLGIRLQPAFTIEEQFVKWLYNDLSAEKLVGYVEVATGDVTCGQTPPAENSNWVVQIRGGVFLSQLAVSARTALRTAELAYSIAAPARLASLRPPIGTDAIWARTGVASREFAKITIQSSHGARHLAGTGLDPSRVEPAIRTEIQQIVKGAASTGEFWGRVEVSGQVIEYRAFTLPNGTINVGTYYPPGAP